MKAAVIRAFGTPDVFSIEDVPEPQLKDNELLVKAEFGSVNPVDWKQRQGNHKFLFGSKFPIIVGYDVAGKVIKTGNEVKRIKAGDYVCGVLPTSSYGGGLAELVKGTEVCFSVVSEAEFGEQFGVLPLAGLTALQALRDKGKVKDRQKVLVIGAAGGVGHYAVQIAQILGAETHVVSSEAHRKFLEKLGNFRFIDYHKQSVLQLEEKFNFIYDTVGKYNFLKCKHLLQRRGVYVTTLPRPKVLLHKMFSRLTKGKRVYSPLMKHSSSDLDQLVQWVNQGKLKPCIDKDFSITDMDKAHRYSEDGHAEGKILIRYSW